MAINGIYEDILRQALVNKGELEVLVRMAGQMWYGCSGWPLREVVIDGADSGEF